MANPCPKADEVRERVRCFNDVFFKEEIAQAGATQAGWKALRLGDAVGVKAFVWQTRVWGRVQYGSQDSAGKLAARLLKLRERLEQLVKETRTGRVRGEVFDLWKEVYDLKAEGGRREASWAAKVLHWLLPEVACVVDLNVAVALDLEKAWTDSRYEDVYKQVLEQVYQCADGLEGDSWLGDVEPRTALRAFDKYLWMVGEAALNRR